MAESYQVSGTRKICALLCTEEKDTMVKVVVNLINKKN